MEEEREQDAENEWKEEVEEGKEGRVKETTDVGKGREVGRERKTKEKDMRDVYKDLHRNGDTLESAV